MEFVFTTTERMDGCEELGLCQNACVRADCLLSFSLFSTLPNLSCLQFEKCCKRAVVDRAGQRPGRSQILNDHERVSFFFLRGSTGHAWSADSTRCSRESGRGTTTTTLQRPTCPFRPLFSSTRRPLALSPSSTTVRPSTIPARDLLFPSGFPQHTSASHPLSRSVDSTRSLRLLLCELWMQRNAVLLKLNFRYSVAWILFASSHRSHRRRP